MAVGDVEDKMTRTSFSIMAGGNQDDNWRGSDLVRIAVAVLATFTIGTSATLAGSGTPNSPPVAIDDAQLQVLKPSIAGADVLPTTRTIPHWWRSIVDQHDGVTYGFNMVGADPYSCSGGACDVTIEVDITPMIVNVDGMTFSGTDVLDALLNSPLFAGNDYGSTPYASIGSITSPVRGAGGPLSQADAGHLLQLQDAIMRAQFKQTGGSNYHLKLHPNVLPSVAINVPNNQGFLAQSGRGSIVAAVDFQWWGDRIHNLVTEGDPTHLALYLTDDVLSYFGNPKDLRFCCFFGWHGANNNRDKLDSNGNPPVQTFAWASWLSPGVYARPNGGLLWHFQDAVAVSHEIAEWANDPFVNNYVEPWSVPGFYLCSPQTTQLETADPVTSAGFAVGTNTFRQAPNPNGTKSADGYYHPQDEAFLPWFMRLSPNLVSEPTQNPSLNVGRYTFMGDLNIFGFDQPASGCPTN
jgi:hypothetical protein